MSSSEIQPTRVGAQEYEALSVQAARQAVPDLDQAAMTVSFNLVRASNRVIKDIEAAIGRSSSISFAAYRVLFSLSAVDSTHPNELARLSGVSTASMSSLLATMSRNGLIEREEDPVDRRRNVISLSTEGRKLVDELLHVVHERERAWAGALSAEEGAILVMLLRRLLTSRPAPPADSDGSVDAP